MKERIETVIDRLEEYVNANGKVSLKQAAAALGLAPPQAERFAALLHERGLIEMHYGFFSVTLFQKAFRQKKKEEPKSPVMGEAVELEEEILKTENLMAFFEKDLERRLLRAKSILQELEGKDEFTQAELDLLRKEIDTALGQLAAFSHEIAQLAEKEKNIYEKLAAFRQKLSKLQARKDIQQPPSFFDKLRAWLSGLTHPRTPPTPRTTQPLTSAHSENAGVVFSALAQITAQKPAQARPTKKKRKRQKT